MAGIEIINNIRTNATQDYKDRIPVASRTNFQSIGYALDQYTQLANEFCEALFNKIGKTIIEKKLFNNRLAKFKSGTVTHQQDVEEIFIEMAKAESTYDKNGSNPLGRRTPPDVKTLYHRMNRQDCYALTVGDIDFVRVFKSESTLDTFITGMINSVYSGANYDEYLCMKNLIVDYVWSKGGEKLHSYYVPMIDSNNDPEKAAKTFVKTLRKAINDLTLEPSDKYNLAGVKTWSQKENLVLFVHKDVVAEVDVEVLAKSFNMGKTDIEPEIVVMNDFGDSEYTYAVLADKDWFRVYDTLSRMESQRNAHGLFTNWFYHVHQILSLSTFKNAVAFTCAD